MMQTPQEIIKAGSKMYEILLDICETTEDMYAVLNIVQAMVQVQNMRNQMGTPFGPGAGSGRL